MVWISTVMQAAVASKNYKEAGHVSREMKETARRQQEVSLSARNPKVGVSHFGARVTSMDFQLE